MPKSIKITGVEAHAMILVLKGTKFADRGADASTLVPIGIKITGDGAHVVNRPKSLIK